MQGILIQYSDNIDGDLSRLKVKNFIEEMKIVAAEVIVYLKKISFVLF